MKLKTLLEEINNSGLEVEIYTSVATHLGNGEYYKIGIGYNNKHDNTSYKGFIIFDPDVEGNGDIFLFSHASVGLCLKHVGLGDMWSAIKPLRRIEKALNKDPEKMFYYKQYNKNRRQFLDMVERWLKGEFIKEFNI